MVVDEVGEFNIVRMEDVFDLGLCGGAGPSHGG